MQIAGFALALFMALASAWPAEAHHPGAALDDVMGSKEKYFQAVDWPAPAFHLVDTEGKPVNLSDYADKIVILHFVYTHCPDICPRHTAKLAEVQKMVNQTPMKDRVQFVGITTDPANDSPELLAKYGENHGLEMSNAAFLTKRPEQEEDSTRKLAEAFGHKFVKVDGGYQMHAIVTHIIDRGGRWAANFHGLRFDPLNMVLYVNGLTNNARPPARKAEPGWWDKLRSLFD